MQQFQSTIKNYVRAQFTRLAIVLDRIFGRRLTPATITWTGFLAHLPIAYFIATDQLFVAGLMLIFFGLFDTLDGALARVQKRASPNGMFLDASTDRLKEVMLYVGFVVLFIDAGMDTEAAMATLACGVSLSVSYVKAKGEAAIAALGTKMSHDKLNRIFEDGIGSFEVRMLLLVLGCLFDVPEYAILIILVITLKTLIERFNKITKALS